MEMDKAVAVLETSLFPLFSVFLCMFVRLRVQGFESSVNKVFQKEKLVNSETIIYSPHLKGLVQQELTYFSCVHYTSFS
jgi:hypothetical protein